MAVRATTDGAAWSFWLYNDFVKPEVGGGAAFDDALEWQVAWTSAGSYGPDVWARAGGRVVPGYSLEADFRTVLGEGSVGRGFSVNTHGGAPFVGTVVGVLWTAGHFDATRYEIHAEPGVTIDAVEMGPSFFASASDFDGPIGAQAQAGLVGAHAVPLGTFTVEAEHGIVGSFWDWSDVSAGSIGADTPSGQRNCDCFFYHQDGPGTYTFTATQAGADRFAMGVMLGGGDVRLPGPP